MQIQLKPIQLKHKFVISNHIKTQNVIKFLILSTRVPKYKPFYKVDQIKQGQISFLLVININSIIYKKN